MNRLRQVEVSALDPEQLAPVLGAARMAAFERVAAATRTALTGRAIINVNSTGAGGGVAEMLRTLLGYSRGVGVDARWLVISGDPAFFRITKRVHNHLYGSPGDGGPLGPAERAHYEQVLAANGTELSALLRPSDVVVLHDPQPAGLAPAVRRAGATVVWRCHVGTDTPTADTELAWEFLRPYVQDADALVFTRKSFAPSWVDPARVHAIAPSIDPLAVKNQPLSDEVVRGVLVHCGLLANGTAPAPAPTFTRSDGSPGRVDRHADVLQTGPPPPLDAPLVVQVSRWDRMKDMPGVITAFAEHVHGVADAHLTLAGPSVTGVADDPEGGQELQACMAVWQQLPHPVRARVHLACLPMADLDENAAIVNALQRHAAVVVQKSLAEGFGLTVVEAMWKSRPVVGSAVGGIAEQIVPGESGLLVEPTDLAGFGAAVRRLLARPDEAARLGEAAHRRAYEYFLGDRHLESYAALLTGLLGSGAR